MQSNLIVRKEFGDVQYLQMPMEVNGASTLVYTHAVCFTDIDIYTTLHELTVEIDF